VNVADGCGGMAVGMGDGVHVGSGGMAVGKGIGVKVGGGGGGVNVGGGTGDGVLVGNGEGVPGGIRNTPKRTWATPKRSKYSTRKL
jgi:hypothetical protein